MATPYWALVDAGFDVEIGSVAGGVAPPDPKTVVAESERPPMVSRFMNDEDAMSILSSTQKASDVNGAYYDCVFLPGDHGAMWDFDSALIGNIVSDAWAADAIAGSVSWPSWPVASKTDGWRLYRQRLTCELFYKCGDRTDWP